MTVKRSRGLSEEDRLLWDKVARSAEPLQRNSTATGRAQPAQKATDPDPPAQKVPPVAREPAIPAPRPEAKSTASARLDRRTVQRLSRGTLALDGRIDLHGLTQAVAHQRLLNFLRQSQRSGAKIVLVITGKGGATARTEHGGLEHTGVLRRAVPQWLRTPQFSSLVVGFDAAGRSHGGSGAFYVRLRRQSKGQES